MQMMLLRATVVINGPFAKYPIPFNSPCSPCEICIITYLGCHGSVSSEFKKPFNVVRLGSFSFDGAGGIQNDHQRRPGFMHSTP